MRLRDRSEGRLPRSMFPCRKGAIKGVNVDFQKPNTRGQSQIVFRHIHSFETIKGARVDFIQNPSIQAHFQPFCRQLPHQY